MFDNERFLTRGVNSEIPSYLQNLMWFMIENIEVEKKDYLQVFELSQEIKDNQPFQKIVHFQEVPKFRVEHVFEASNIITNKVYIIDDEDHCTMLLA